LNANALISIEFSGIFFTPGLKAAIDNAEMIRPSPPLVAAPLIPDPPSLSTPGLWRRMACWFYEGILLFGIIFIAGWLFSTLGQMRNATDPVRQPLLQAFLFIVLGLYFAWSWSHGQTLAMKTWHIRIVGRDGRPISLYRAFIRYVLAWIWFLPPLALAAPLRLQGTSTVLLMAGWICIWALLSRLHPNKQFWHDAWIGTRLVRSAPLHNN
jgi:uncharacterized RDD family membrane protein YckC